MGRLLLQGSFLLLFQYNPLFTFQAACRAGAKRDEVSIDQPVEKSLNLVEENFYKITVR